MYLLQHNAMCDTRVFIHVMTVTFVHTTNYHKIKIMLKRRKESDTYLATFCRHPWSAEMMMKKDNLLELYASTVAFIS